MTEKQLINLGIIGVLWLKVCSRLNERKSPPSWWCELRLNLQRTASKGPDFCHVCVLIFCYCYVCRLGLLGLLCRSAAEVCAAPCVCFESADVASYIKEHWKSKCLIFTCSLSSSCLKPPWHNLTQSQGARLVWNVFLWVENHCLYSISVCVCALVFCASHFSPVTLQSRITVVTWP